MSTPTPAPASYTKLADMTGDRTSQTAGIGFTTSDTPDYRNGATQSFGSGITVAYTAATDSYKFTAPDGTTTALPSRSVRSAEPERSAAAGPGSAAH